MCVFGVRVEVYNESAPDNSNRVRQVHQVDSNPIQSNNPTKPNQTRSNNFNNSSVPFNNNPVPFQSQSKSNPTVPFVRPNRSVPKPFKTLQKRKQTPKTRGLPGRSILFSTNYKRPFIYPSYLSLPNKYETSVRVCFNSSTLYPRPAVVYETTNETVLDVLYCLLQYIRHIPAVQTRPKPLV